MSEDSNENDEEISLDFSKITKLFKRKKESDKVKEIEKETKIVGKEVKEKIDKEEEKTEKLIDEEKKIEETKKDIEEEKKGGEKKLEKEKFEGEIKKDKEKIEEIREDIEKEDDEIAIDLSKITKFFRKKKPKKEDVKTKEESSEEEEISLDFGKIKSFFKGIKGTKEAAKSETEEEISFDAKKTINFFNKNKNILIPIIIILFAVSLSVYLRIQPANLPVTDDWATDSVYNFFRSEIRSQIEQQYPNLPDVNKNQLVETEFERLLKEQKPQIEQQIEATSSNFKSRLQNDKGQTYLLAIDPYFWMRQAENIVEHGYPGDEIRDGVQYDNHMIAPIGRPNPGDTFHPYLEAYLFKFLRFFNKDLDLMKLVFYIPILISVLAIIPAFFIARRIGGNFAGAVAAVIVAIHPAFLNRTAGGFADTDAYNVLFPLLIVWLFLEAFESKNIKKSVILIGLSGFFVGLYSFTWGGWWFIFDFILASLIVYIVYYLLTHRNDLKKGIINFIKQPAIKTLLVITIVFLLSSLIFVTAFRDYYTFKTAPAQPFQFTKIKEVGISKIWPNVFTTVAEQNVASLGDIISQIGGKFLFLIALIGITLMMIRKETKKKGDLWFIIFSIIWFLILLNIQFQNLIMFLVLLSMPIIIKFILIIKEGEAKIDIKIAILLIMWFVATIYAGTKGIRWVLLLVPAFGVAFGVALGYLYRYLSGAVIKELKINRIIAKTTIVILLCLLLIGPWNSAKSTAKREIPSMNDAWYNSLDKIKREAAPDAIINSWWDFGHWFKAIGDRAVTFDGTSQDVSQAHWIGNTLLTDNEDTAVGILRMLDCGATTALVELNKVINDVAKSVDILYEVMVLSKKDAEKILSGYGLNNEEVNSVLEYTHCEAPENYFITSQDMVNKAGVWAHFGSWDFDKATIINTLNKKEYKKDKEKSIKFLQDRFNYKEDEANNLYYEVQALTDSRDINSWISPWPSYASGLSGCNKVTNETITCSLGQGAVLINLTTMEANLATQDGIKHPDSLVYPTKEGIVEKKFNDAIGFSMVLIPSGDSYQSIMMHPQLAASMFTRLFYMEGHGLKHFKKFSDERSIFGERIIVWKVDWEGSEANILDVFKPKTEEAVVDETKIEEIKNTSTEQIKINNTTNET